MAAALESGIHPFAITLTHIHTHYSNRTKQTVCFPPIYLTGGHETRAFCSWLPISSINSLPLLATPPPPHIQLHPLPSLLPLPCPKRPPWLPVAMATTCWVTSLWASTTLWQLVERKSIIEQDFFFFFFSAIPPPKILIWDGKTPLSTYQSTVKSL